MQNYLYICTMDKKYLIHFGDNTFEASEYQIKIFQCIEYGVGNMVINASAGSSKTTSIVNGINYIPKEKRVLFVAFNKDIASKIKTLVERENTNVHTFHSLGRSILIENNIITEDTPINEYKYNTYIKENIETLSKEGELRSLKNNYNTYISNITKLCEYCRYFHYMQKNKIKKLAKFYGITIIRDEIDVVIEVLKWGTKCQDEIDYTDMIWLPVQLNLTTKNKLYDFIFVDEAQDTSIVEQELVFKTFKRGARFCIIGDTKQSINIWCGATEEAIDVFLKQPNTQTFNLPISYRCPRKIVDFVQQFTDNIISAPNAIEGEINYEVSPNYAQAGDMILCRNTAPLIKLHLLYLRNNKKSFIRGFENIKTEYLSLIQNSNSKFIDKNILTTDGLIPTLYKQLFQQMEYLKKDFSLSEEELVVHPKILEMYDNIQGIISLSDSINTTEELIDKINTVFSGNELNAIQLSTIHKAKGLEADNVFILCPSLLPNPYAKLDWEKRTEINLQYVAYTRAKKTLNFIKEDKSSQWENIKNQFSVKAMTKTFNEIKAKLNYNTDFQCKENDILTKKIETIQTIGTKTFYNLGYTNNTKKAGLKFSKLINK